MRPTPGAAANAGTDTRLLERTARLRVQTINAQQGTLGGFFCPQCRNKGYFAARNGTAVELVSCGCGERRRSLKRMEESGLSALLAHCTLERFLTPEPWQRAAKAEAESYLRAPGGRWFLMCGTPGSGKTHLCTAICAHFLAAGRSVRYMLWRDDAQKLKAAVTDGAAYERLIGPFKRADVLYIDDFWKTDRRAAPTAGDINLAFELIAYRYRDPKCLTVISCERTPAELLSVDEAVGSRIFERTKGGRVIVTGRNNWRLREGREA